MRPPSSSSTPAPRRAAAGAGCGWIAPQPQQDRRQQAPAASPSSSPSSPPPQPLQPQQVQHLLKRRLPSLATAAWALCFSGAGLLPTPPLPFGGPAPGAVAVAATLPSTPTPTLLIAGATANSPARSGVLLLPIVKIEAAIDEVGRLLKVWEGLGVWKQGRGGGTDRSVDRSVSLCVGRLSLALFIGTPSSTYPQSKSNDTLTPASK